MGYEKNTYGKPVFDDQYDFPQDSQAAVDYADEFANVRVGTSAERQALPVGKQRPGMLWVERDTNRLYMTNGAGVWTDLAALTAWQSLTAVGTWTANTGGGAPQVSRNGYQASLRGGFYGGGANTTATTLPAWARPSRELRVPLMLANNTAFGVARIFPNGDVQPSGDISTTSFITWSVI